MENLLGFTSFIRALSEKKLGFTTVYYVPPGKTYYQTTNSLIAIAAREKVAISVNQVIVVDPVNLVTTEAIRVTRK